MERKRLMFEFENPFKRSQRNRILPMEDKTPAASFTWGNIATALDPTYIYPSVRLTGVTEQITLQFTMDNTANMTAEIVVQGSTAGFVTAPFTSYTMTNVSQSALINVSPGDSVILIVTNDDPVGNPQTTNMTVRNYSVTNGVTPYTVISSFSVSITPPP